MRWYRRISLQWKILLSFLVFMLVLSAVLWLMLRNIAQNERDYYNGRLTQSNDLIDDKLTTLLDDLRFTSAMYLVNTDILALVEKDFEVGTSRYVEALRQLKSNTLSVKVNPNLSSVTYLTRSREVYSGAGYSEPYLSYLQAVADELDKTGAKYLVTPAYDTTINQQRMTTITYAFRLNNPYNFRPVGYGFINIDMKRLAQSFAVQTLSEESSAFAVQDGRVLFTDGAKDEARNQAIAQAVSDGDGALFTVTAAGKGYLCAAKRNEALRMTVVSCTPLELVNARIAGAVRIYTSMACVLLALFLGVGAVLSFTMTKPIRILQAGIKTVERGRFEPITEETERPDDMGELIRGFNHMVKTIKESILHEYESRDLQKRAQLKMLESQINPHFLNNALNLISSIGTLENVPQVSDIATDLADLFRYSISSDSAVPLEKELEQVRRYIDIQRLCMAGDLTVEYRVEPAAHDWLVPKFLLQPLVENCFIHGFGKRNAGGKLVIEARVTDGGLAVMVEDDGMGISGERLDELQRLCEEPLETNERLGSVGMLNVNYRLKAFYGEGCGVKIDSEQGRGTRLSMLIPAAMPPHGAETEG